MEAPEIIRLILLALHILGLAAIVGVFFAQMRATEGFKTGLMLTGAIVQLVTGLGLVGVAEMGEGAVNHMKVGVKLVIALIVLIGAIIAHVQNRKGGKVKPGFHAAGGFAVINVLVAVLWQ